MPAARLALTVVPVTLFMLTAVAASPAGEPDSPETLVQWADIQPGRYTVAAVVAEREGEPLDRVLAARPGSAVNVTIDDEAIELQLPASEARIRLPRNRRANAGDGKHPYTHLGKPQKLMRVVESEDKQQLTFTVLYTGHFVLESAGD